MSNTIRRSGVLNKPKFMRCASPHSWTFNPDRAPPERSDAMISAAHRQKVNGDTSMRP
jgi:hypothetical protein